MTGGLRFPVPSSLHTRALDWLGLHQNELVGWRRELHSHPEVGYAEHRTTDLIVVGAQPASGWLPGGCPSAPG